MAGQHYQQHHSMLYPELIFNRLQNSEDLRSVLVQQKGLTLHLEIGTEDRLVHYTLIIHLPD